MQVSLHLSCGLIALLYIPLTNLLGTPWQTPSFHTPLDSSVRYRGVVGWRVTSKSCVHQQHQNVTSVGIRAFVDIIKVRIARWNPPGFRWALNPMMRVLRREERSKDTKEQGEDHVKSWSDGLQAEGSPWISSGFCELERGPEWLIPRASRGNQPCHDRNFGLPASRTVGASISTAALEN